MRPEPPGLDEADTAVLESDLLMSGKQEALARAATNITQRVHDELSRRALPSATYRLQFNRDFTFRMATELVPYLHELGVSHVYASPYWKARAGSQHGYDVVDPTSLNPEIGSEDDFRQFVAALRRFGMGHVADVVPNHLGISSNENAWWWDVLENGPSSRYSHYFDIDWQPLKPDLASKVLLPVLGDQFGRVLENQQLRLHFAQGSFQLHYFQQRFPIAPGSWPQVLRHRLDDLETWLGKDAPDLLEYQSILTALDHLPPREDTDPARQDERYREHEVIRRRLSRLCDECPAVREFIAANVALFNGTPGEPRSFDLLDRLLDSQAYRLCWWKVAADEINYRRFFDINELAAVCMEQPDVLEATHALVLRLLDEGQIDGLRIDHADGLYDPIGYLRQLQQARFLQHCRQAHAQEPGGVEWGEVEPVLRAEFARLQAEAPRSPLARPLYVVVEKILEREESLPADWPAWGTTGYEFLNDVNGLFVDARHEKALASIYRRFTHQSASFEHLAYAGKKLIMLVSMSSELHGLAHQLDRISERHRLSRDFTLNGLTRALRETVACFPVYRTYIVDGVVAARDRKYIESAVARAKRHNPTISAEVFDFIRDVLCLRFADGVDEAQRAAHQRFVQRFQQFTGPMMAKAVEDTAFYSYNRLVSLNEVGGSPDTFGCSLDTFHRRNQQRQAFRPQGLLATATHDTKRGEDMRVRIDVLSEIPEWWKTHLFQWSRWNKRHKTKVDGEPAPSRNDEILLYQTLLGTWPFAPPHGDDLQQYVGRIQQYMVKAVREAKMVSSWIAPHEAYEKALTDFIAAILNDNPDSAFRLDFEPLARVVARIGVWNSLSQTLLKTASPGVADFYQGTELWDLHLVDPDNRGPVDFAARRNLLAALVKRTAAFSEDRSELLNELLASPDDGRIKLFVTYLMLRLRRLEPALCTVGEYLPLPVVGERREHVCAFARLHEGRAVVVAAPRWMAGLTAEMGQPPLGVDVWRDTVIELPGELGAGTWRDVFSGRELSPAGDGRFAVADLLNVFPLAVLCRQPEINLDDLRPLI